MIESSTAEQQELNAQVADALQHGDVHPIGMRQEDTIALLRSSLDFFESFFLDTTTLLPIPDFHRENWSIIINPPCSKVALAWPRGFAKSTLLKLSCVYFWLFTEFRFIAYTSLTHSVAVHDCQDIIGYIESDNFKATFGTPVFSIKQESFGVWLFEINVPDPDNPKLFKIKRCILKAFGAGQQIRGSLIDNCRPEIGIADDLEDEFTVASETKLQALFNWFYSSYSKAFDRKHSRLYVLGNMLSSKSLIYDLTDKSPLWFGRRFGCIKSDGTALWPDMLTLDEIRVDFKEHLRLGRLATWYAEMMNMPIADDSAVITLDLIQFLPPILPQEADYCFITCDPAISTKETSDDRAISVHAYAHNAWRTVDYVVGKFTYEQLFFHIVEMTIKWRTISVCIELNGFAALLEPLFKVLMAQYHSYFKIYPVSHRNVPKRDRIAAWCTMLRTKTWSLQEGSTAIVNQLLNYDTSTKNNTDDLIDSCSMSVPALQLYKSTIMEDRLRWSVIHGGQYNPLAARHIITAQSVV